MHKRVSQLTRKQLETIVVGLLEGLYLVDVPEGSDNFLIDPDRQHDSACDFVDNVAETLRELHLVPPTICALEHGL